MITVMLQRTRASVSKLLPVLFLGVLAATGQVRAAEASLDDMFVSANRALNGGQAREAVRILTRAQQLAPNDPEVLLMRARAYTSDGDYARALADVNRAIQMRPDDPEMYLARARVYRADDKFPLALADADKAVSLAPNSSDAYLSRADIHRDMGNNAAADADEARADEIDRAAP